MAELSLVEYTKDGSGNYTINSSTLTLDNLNPASLKKDVEQKWRRGRPRQTGIRVRYRDRVQEDYQVQGYCILNKRLQIESYQKRDSKYKMTWATNSMKSPTKADPASFETIYVIFGKVSFQRFSGSKGAPPSGELYQYTIKFHRCVL